jgi:hypothetical protein
MVLLLGQNRLAVVDQGEGENRVCKCSDREISIRKFQISVETDVTKQEAKEPSKAILTTLRSRGYRGSQGGGIPILTQASVTFRLWYFCLCHPHRNVVLS